MVAVGGALGALLRSLVPDTADLATVPWPTLAVNVGGSFALGLLVGLVTRHDGPSWVRPTLGTGLLGGFTTFSLYAVQAAERLDGHPGTALAYAALTLVAAVGAAAAGLGLAARPGRPR